MPYLFFTERIGHRDEPCQPWEGTRGDWYDLEPHIAARFLPFPDSPLDNRGHQAAEEVEKSRERAQSVSPLPELGQEYIPYLGISQALQETRYTILEGTTVHQKITRYWIRPRNSHPTGSDASPSFVHKEWDSTSGSPAPVWTNIDTSMAGWKVRTLQEAVHTVARYSRKPVNATIAPDIQEWVLEITPKASATESGDEWALSTPPRTRKSRRIAESTRGRAERFHYEAVY
ncbi:hypothetical protein C8R44DRAFT_807135 [Mycena epipterygia]|nr:hypothetical protein C8R44DRAFT_807135 [Mycena epipterygia]